MNIYFYNINCKPCRKTDDLIRESVLRYAQLAGLQEKVLFEIKRTQSGKPFLDGLPLCVGVSHTGNIAAIAVSGQNFGIDMELKDRQITNIGAITKRFYFEKEREFVNAAAAESEKNSRALEIWVKKEAFLKCLGTGLSAINRADTEAVCGKFRKVEHKAMIIYVYFEDKNADEEIFCID